MKKSIYLLFAVVVSCNFSQREPTPEAIKAINLKQGEVIWCGPPMANFGSVNFLVSTSPEVKKQFDQAIAMLHSFEYGEAEKAFASVIKSDRACAMAYWGVAMSNFHPLWEPPSPDDLVKGNEAIRVARGIEKMSSRERDYVNAIGAFYDNWQTVDHKSRCRKYEIAMEELFKKYPDDNEAAIFYALALNTTADPTDKSYKNQRKAGEILNNVAETHPDHPGIIHYIIHNYDNPDLAEIALPAARKYAALAPASAHAQHMPSHIFIRLGLWDEAITSNIASVNSAQCYAEKAALNGNFDEELHGLDYLMYAYLQKGDNANAEQQLNYLKGIKKVSAKNLKVAYAYAAMPARYILENRKWKDAAQLQSYPADFPWNKFPWQSAITVFTRLLGKVHLHDFQGAEHELKQLQQLHELLVFMKDQYKARQVEVQIKSGTAWLALKKDDHAQAESLMREAADIEDGTMKHPVTPGEVIPARELLADMLIELKKPDMALAAYKTDLAMHANRLNGIRGMQLAEQLVKK